MFTTNLIPFILIVIYIFYSNARSRRISREKIDSVKQSFNARLDSVKRDLSNTIDRSKNQDHTGFNNLLALLGYAKMMISDEGGLVLVVDFEGKKFIADTNINPIRFYPAKEVKTKKGMNVTKYNGKMYEFKAMEKLAPTTCDF